jgi:hypothetical protein
VLRRTHAIIAFVLPLCVAAGAGAEEPSLRCDVEGTLPRVPAEKTPADDVEATPSEQGISEAPAAEAQGAAVPIFESGSEPRASREAAPPARVQRSLPPSVQSTPASGSGAVLGLRLPAFIAFGIGGLGAGGAVVTHLAAQDERVAEQGRRQRLLGVLSAAGRRAPNGA